jgi:hypothetical protein
VAYSGILPESTKASGSIAAILTGFASSQFIPDDPAVSQVPYPSSEMIYLIREEIMGND